MRCLAIFPMLLFLSCPAFADPLPDVKVNGFDGPVYAVSGDIVTVAISLDPMEKAGQSADWWVGARTRWGWFGHDKATGDWVYAGASFNDITVWQQGPLTSVSGYELSSLTGLLHGAYEVYFGEVYFGVDMDMDGTLDKNVSFSDHATVNRMAMFLPDTGQTQSYTDTFGEDSDYTINPPSFTDNGDGTITDNITGLVWQKQDDDKRREWQNARSYCNGLELGGNADWRLPAVVELQSIADYGRSAPAIDTTYFPGTMSTYWTSERWVHSPEDWMWIADSYSGGILESPYWDVTYTRCVRGQMDRPGPDERFTDNGNGAVTDGVTGLMWQKVEEKGRLWDKAIQYCDGLVLAGYADWRLPNVKELASLADRAREDPALDKRYFPNVESDQYWTSTTWDNDSLQAFFVEFTGGGADWYPNNGGWAGYRFNVRCVRGEPLR